MYQSLTNPRSTIKISPIGFFKIVIIIFVSYSLTANAIPYYDGADAYVYGITAIQITEGKFGFTNHLLEQTGNTKYVPQQWVKTIYNTAIPIGGVGIYGLSSLFYLIGGFYGLLYLSPIFTILLMIVSERVVTKLFGSFVGFVSLLFIISDWKIFQNGIQLLNDNVFALLFVFGIFFLIKFLRENNNKFILASSIFFAASTFFRINGAIFFPIELIILVSFYFVTNYQNSINKQHLYKFLGSELLQIKKTLSTKMNIKKFLIICTFIFVPWIIFLGFWYGYNTHFFGDPFTNYESERLISIDKKYTQEIILSQNLTQEEISGISEEQLQEIEKNQKVQRKSTTNPLTSFFIFDSERLWWASYFAASLIPDTLENLLKYVSDTRIQEDWKSKNWMSVFSLFIISLSLLLAFYYKKHRTEIIVFSLFIVGFLFFFSSDYIHPSGNFPPSGGIQDRYMVPASILTFILTGFILNWLWKFDFKNVFRKNSFIFPKILRLTIISAIVLFLIGTFYIMPSVQAVLQESFTFNNPVEFNNRYPLDKEGLTSESIVVGDYGRNTVEYGAIHIFPYEGFQRKDPIFKPETLNPIVILDLKRLILEGYDVYVFKKDMWPTDEKYFRYLEDEHGLILKNYSETFCKVELISPNMQKSTAHISDSTCYSDVRGDSMKVWKIWLRTPQELIENKKLDS